MTATTKIKPRFRTGTDKAEFWCVWKGNHYRLASFAMHHLKNVPQGSYLLIDPQYKTQIVPQSEVHISSRI